MQQISLKNHFGESLKGWKNLSGKSSAPAIVIVHGFASSSKSDLLTELGQELAKNGFDAYCLTFSGMDESEGKYRETTLSKQVKELSEIIEFVRSQVKGKLFVFAQSFGTAATIGLNPKVDGIILAGSARDHLNKLKNKFGDQLNVDGESSFIRKKTGEKIEIGPEFWPDLEKYDFVKLVSKIKTPILFVQGEKDSTTEVEQMEFLFNGANEPKEKYIVPGAEHKLEENRQLAFSKIIEWLKKQNNQKS